MQNKKFSIVLKKNMVITINKQAKEFISEYKNVLTQYPISSQRANEKIDKLTKSINDLAVMPTRWHICPYKDMGQRFLKGKTGNERFIYKNLRLMIYEDKKSKTKIYISYYVNEANDEIIVYRMSFPKHIKENKEGYEETKRLYESIMRDVAKVIKSHLES